jgi:hypothetical protein
VLIRAVVGHEIEDQADAALVQRRHQAVEIVTRAEQRVDADVVRDVVAEVGHRRGIDRADPDRIDAEPGQIVDPLDDSLEIAHPVAVAVLERARINLVDDGLLPPGQLTGPHGCTFPPLPLVTVRHTSGPLRYRAPWRTRAASVSRSAVGLWRRGFAGRLRLPACFCQLLV